MCSSECWTVTALRVIRVGFRHSMVGISRPSIVSSFRVLDFSVDFDLRFLLCDAAIVVFTGSAYTHVQSDHFHACSPCREERSKLFLWHCSRDELLSARPARLTPDLAAVYGLSISCFACLEGPLGGEGEEGK